MKEIGLIVDNFFGGTARVLVPFFFVAPLLVEGKKGRCLFSEDVSGATSRRWWR